MDSQQYTHIEQDHNIPKSGDQLPTYDDLAVQGGPNSRFGRWRGWIEKRAAERYNDITPQERTQRRERGWGNAEIEAHEAQQHQHYQSPSAPIPPHLSLDTRHLDSYPEPSEAPETPNPLPPAPPVSQRLEPTHLKMDQFGSRFLPHSTSPIRCVLPLLSDRLILIGHDEGLSVLDMYPQEWSNSGDLIVKGPDEAQARPIWTGESVSQITLLEVEQSSSGTPQGVVLLLVGPTGDSCSPGKDSETLRSLRMYNLASLTSLAKWTVAQKGAKPIDLRGPSNHAPQTPKKQHRPQHSIARSIKNFIESPSHSHSHDSSYSNLLTPSASASVSAAGSSKPRSRSPNKRQDSDDSGWDVIEDLPLRWATDYVPLASPGSRLVNTPVLSYALWFGDNPRVRGQGRLLAVATKTNILLYETPKGERAFRFVKEFYTPLPPRNITFFQQTVPEVTRSNSTLTPPRSSHAHKRSESTGGSRSSFASSATATSSINYGPQLCLFVIFDKKAGWIRLADSAVGEMEWYDDGSLHAGSAGFHHRDSTNGSTNSRRSRLSFDPPAPRWIKPSQCELPIAPSSRSSALTTKVHVLTRGRQTHILPCPLPVGTTPAVPLRVVNWKSAPSAVVPRVCVGHGTVDAGRPAVLQLISLGEHGVEVQELSLAFLDKGKSKGKGKAPADETVWADVDTGGDTGFLGHGGHWDDPRYLPFGDDSRPELTRSASATSSVSAFSDMTISSEDLDMRSKQEEGVYAWCRKGLEDWRVFWLGGRTTDNVNG